MNKLVVGQKLWYVLNYQPTPQYQVTIEKIGRKWAQLSGCRKERVDIETLRVDGGKYNSPGQCYLTKEDYDNQIKLEDAWRRFIIREIQKFLGLGGENGQL